MLAVLGTQNKDRHKMAALNGHLGQMVILHGRPACHIFNVVHLKAMTAQDMDRYQSPKSGF